MEDLIERAGRGLAVAYAIYMGLLFVLGYVGVHLAILVCLLYFMQRRARAREQGRRVRSFNLLPLELVYGFVNPLIYLLIIEPYGAFRARLVIDTWLTALAWTLFAALWGGRLLLPSSIEAKPAWRKKLEWLCVLGLACLATFAAIDLIRAWPAAALSFWHGAFLLYAFGPLYLIPAVLLNRYRVRLARADGKARLLLLTATGARRLALAAAVLVAFTIALAMARPSVATARARVERLAPKILETSARYDVDPRVLAAIVYVTQHDQIEPFRDELERFVMAGFLFDADSGAMLSKPLDLSIGVAQIKPNTAMTALKICQSLGVPWDLAATHLRDVPPLGAEWQLGENAQAVCRPPVSPIPTTKPVVVSTLLRDDGNLAFAAFILGLYQRQWRDAQPGADIAGRPDILATLYQIGFTRSHPHESPRSNGFGRRVAEVYREGWLQQRFEGPRIARAVR